MDDRLRRLSVHPGEEDRLAYGGWELAGKAAFNEAVAELSHQGSAPHPGTEEECEQRQVLGLARFQDPYGFTHEVYYGPTYNIGSFLPGKPMAGRFVGGAEGVGHVVFAIPEMTPEMEQFITGILGMELFTTLPAGRGPEAHFYRCNPRTHCLAYAIVPSHKGVHHLAIEGTHMDDVGRAWDLVQERELPITTTLGRHMPDTLISFYMRTPTGFDIEFGAQGERLDDDYVQITPATPEGWGHKFVGDGLPATVRPVVSEEHATSEE